MASHKKDWFERLTDGFYDSNQKGLNPKEYREAFNQAVLCTPYF